VGIGGLPRLGKGKTTHAKGVRTDESNVDQKGEGTRGCRELPGVLEGRESYLRSWGEREKTSAS